MCVYICIYTYIQADALDEARSWLSFLHNDEDHINMINIT